MNARNRWILSAIVGVYLVVSSVHGVTHFAVPVGLTPFQWAFILIVASTAPVVALGLLWTGRELIGLPLLVVSMVGGFVFGVYFHFLVPNPDNVGHVHGPWALEFEVTAVLIAVTSFAGAIFGIWLWLRDPTERDEPLETPTG